MTRRLLKFAKDMRRDATDAESSIWRQLRAHRFQGWKFKRQQTLGPYIVDFVCFDQKLVIEIDGGQHGDQASYDRDRTRWLEEQGFRVLRFWNNEVAMNLQDVLEAISTALAQSAPSPQPLSHKGRGAKTSQLSSRGRSRRAAPGEGA
ncbi:MAG: DUF559 domain-containing protein [Proteobacteria bacterium]|nr:DUF559 domain-containing protein [Pseudomonadota bacterium]